MGYIGKLPTLTKKGGGTGVTTIGTAGSLNILSIGATTVSNSLISTNHGVLLGGSSNAVTSTAAGTAGQALRSAGAASDPSYATLAVAAGGTGATTLSSGQILLGSGVSPIAGGVQTYTNASTFTPSLTFGGGSTGLTYTTQYGKYSRFRGASAGIVIFEIYLLLSAKGSSTGNAAISTPVSTVSDGSIKSIPFTGLNVSADAGNTYYYGNIPSGSSTITLFESNANTGTNTNLTHVHFANNSSVRIFGWYMI